MARANGRDTQIRAALETIAAELAVMKDAGLIARLRVDQAIQRSGLAALLEPALDEQDRIARSVTTAQAQVNSALAILTKKE
jgi:hypothetical protein